MPKGKSRPKRWAEAVAACMKLKDEVEAKADELATALSDLYDIQQEYQEWKDNLPENVESSALGEKLDAVCDLSLDNNGCGADIMGDWDSVVSAIEEAEQIELPMGFGRD